MTKYGNLPTLILIGLVCIISGILGGLQVLPSEAVTAILGGAIAQAVGMVRGKAGDATPQMPSLASEAHDEAAGPAADGSGSRLPAAGTAVAMLGGALLPLMAGVL